MAFDQIWLIAIYLDGLAITQQQDKKWQGKANG